MAHRRRDDETNDYYDINFINEIHTHFPALLYNTDRFTSVRDLLAYVRARVAARYSHFPIAQRNYNQMMRRGFENLQTDRPIRFTGAAARAQAAERAAARAARPRRHFFNHNLTPADARAQAPAAVQQQQQQQQQHRDDFQRIFNPLYPTINTPIGQTTNTLFPGLTVPSLTTAPFATHTLATTHTTFPLTPLFPTFTTTLGLDQPTTIIQDEIDGANALLALLGLITPGPATTNAQLLAPVIIRPSNEVIDATTVTETVSSPPPPAGICVICQEEFAVNNQLKRIRHCGHVFHNECIMTHFETSVRCPTCRHDIRDSAAPTSATNPS